MNDSVGNYSKHNENETDISTLLLSEKMLNQPELNQKLKISSQRFDEQRFNHLRPRQQQQHPD
jgi:hypothetical protein